MAELVQDYPSLKWLGQLADGRSDFDIGFTIAHVPGSDALAQTLNVDSPLSGIALALPAPLDKPASDEPATASDDEPAGRWQRSASWRLGDVMRGHLRLSDGAQHPLAATLAFGNQMPEQLPAKRPAHPGACRPAGCHRLGAVARWPAGSGGNGPGLESLDVSTDQAGWFGRPSGPLELRATPQPDLLSVDVDGAAMAGNFSVPTQELDKRGVTARLQRLYWPKDTAPGHAKPDRPPEPGHAGAKVPCRLPIRPTPASIPRRCHRSTCG